VNHISIKRLVHGISGRGSHALRAKTAIVRRWLPGRRARQCALVRLAHCLVSSRGEASGIAIATRLLNLYDLASPHTREQFLRELAENFGPDREQLAKAWGRFATSGWSAYPALCLAVEAPRQELFRRLNLTPGGTHRLVRMRQDLSAMADRHSASLVDADLLHLLRSWFNRGFLSFSPITWSSPADLLERVIRHEAVHNIHSWDALRDRLLPADRRCYGFFHQSMPGEPLIFVEVALTRGTPGSIAPLLASDRDVLDAGAADTAVFYSISNCQDGLRGISFGNFLIKQVAEDLRRELPGLRTFVTLSPIPGFMAWLKREHGALAARIEPLIDNPAIESHRDKLLQACATYLAYARDGHNRPLDPVARFHLGNGASIERLNWAADGSAKGLRQSAGMMVNYRYELGRVEDRHDAHAQDGTISMSTAFRRVFGRRWPGSTAGDQHAR